MSELNKMFILISQGEGEIGRHGKTICCSPDLYEMNLQLYSCLPILDKEKTTGETINPDHAIYLMT
jgi:hypothetical protein